MNETKKGGFKALTQKKIFSLICMYIVMVIIFTVWAELKHTHFLTVPVFKNILNSLVVTSFLTLGAGCLLIGGYLDLAQSAIGCFGSMVLATAIAAWHFPWYVAIIVALALCAVFGAINALMVTKLRFPAFIGTLAMASMVRGLMYVFSSMGNNGTAANINFVDSTISFIGTGTIAGIPFGVIVMIIFFIIFGLLMSKTGFGMKVTLMGGSPVAATLAGINAEGLTIVLFIISAVMGGIGGIFNAARLSQGALTALTTNQFTGLTAAILGGISFGGGVGGMGGAFVGLLILNTFQIGMGIVGVNPFWVNVFSGVLLLLALALDFIAIQRKSKALAH
ncbi:MAG: ABC transporter permease [Ruminococcaceae bacterium]|jgi:ribose/xylose/arabinose/galactoside ABC-type transport system permease subunit|nr:ABC transporter permease [Oscillospiraceae bacterium]